MKMGYTKIGNYVSWKSITRNYSKDYKIKAITVGDW